jgi:uncharacterized protein
MSEPMLIARGEADLFVLPAMANRHGLIAGATGTGKTVSIQRLAEELSLRGVPVFLADIKGDLAGLSQPGADSPKILERVQQLGVQNFAGEAFPVVFWDVFGSDGHPVRTTVSEMGPLLLARVLQLNETQTGVLQLIFRVADENGLLLLDLKDLRAMLRHASENAAQISGEYGKISTASIGAIQRNLLVLEEQGGASFFGEPSLRLEDMIQTDGRGRGVINVLAADKLINAPALYATVLLWLLAELFEELPEAGDLTKPKLVFFFDEAHLLFEDIPNVVEEKVEQIVRLIRSKGVGVYFATQNPRDLPDEVLGQLGNRIQHALRGFTPSDQKVVKAAAQTFRQNPKINTETVLTQLAVGEALVSMLDVSGQPQPVQRALIYPPRSHVGSISQEAREKLMRSSGMQGKYDQLLDRESAYERLKAVAETASGPAVRHDETGGPPPERSRGRPPEDMMTAVLKSAMRAAGSQIGRSLIRGILGSLSRGRR